MRTAPSFTRRRFHDRGWSNGAALLGFGDINGQPPTTQVASNRQWTTYSRQTFAVANPGQFTNLTLRLVRNSPRRSRGRPLPIQSAVTARGCACPSPPTSCSVTSNCTCRENLKQAMND
jgi:hypothetical protein